MYSLLQMLIRRNFTVLFLMIGLLLYALPLAAGIETEVKATVAPDIDIDDADFLPLGGEIDRLLGETKTSHLVPTLHLPQEQP